jgi:hypothetical protein
MHSPLEQRSARPVQSESFVHAMQPDAAHTRPPHEALPLQVHAPATHSFVPSEQSAFVQQALTEMHEPPHGFWSAAQLADESPRAVVPSGRLASPPRPPSSAPVVDLLVPHATAIRTAKRPADHHDFRMTKLRFSTCRVSSDTLARSPWVRDPRDTALAVAQSSGSRQSFFTTRTTLSSGWRSMSLFSGSIPAL